MNDYTVEEGDASQHIAVKFDSYPIEYTVKEGDTVQHVAVKFGCHPSDLLKENKLSPFQRVLFAGQKLTIPTFEVKARNSKLSLPVYNDRIPRGSHPGIATRISDPVTRQRSTSLISNKEDISERQFVKLHACRVVNYDSTPCSGTLLITPRFLAFDPDRIHNDDDQIDEFSIAEPIDNVAVTVSLDSVFSLNTYSKLSDLMNEKQIKSENSPGVVDSHSFEITDEIEILYLVLKAVPLSDSYTGPTFASNTINLLHKDCKLFAFSIEKERFEEVYSFLISCIAAACNKVHDDVQEVAVISKDDEEEEELCIEFKDESSYKHLQSILSWEMVDQSQISVVADALKEFEEFKFNLQYSNGHSDILSDSMLEDLAASLPVNLNGCNLTLVYKTAIHGYSLGTIYRKMKAFNSATLLLIRDNSNTVFGAFMSDPFRISTHYYGTGETFVFHWSSDFKKYEWTRENSFFMKGDVNCFAIGAKSGHNAIWFEDTLNFGRSEPTDTFDNPTLCGNCDTTGGNHVEAMIKSLSVDKSSTVTSTTCATLGYFFVIDCLEVWRFSV